MFYALSERLSGVLNGLMCAKTVSAQQVSEVLKEIRVALLEADVSLEVVTPFLDTVRDRAITSEVLGSLTPGQQVIKVVRETLVDLLLGPESSELDLQGTVPATIMVMGLQGSGKTTTVAKLGLYLSKKQKKRVLLASLDVRRPAAQEQLKILGEQNDIDTLATVDGENALEIAERALSVASLRGYDVLVMDTAGSIQVDKKAMDELSEIKRITVPRELILVVDSLIGQEAVSVAKGFSHAVGINGIILTRMDSDSRGGAALSMKYATSIPIKFIGTGESVESFDIFDPYRVAGRILGMGDVVKLVEKAVGNLTEQQKQEEIDKLNRGKFSFDDLAEQLKKMQKLGGLQKILEFLPSIGGLRGLVGSSKMDDSLLRRQLAIISSMTKAEKKDPGILNNSRRRRIACGSGTSVEQVNNLVAQYKKMVLMVSTLSRTDGGMVGAVKSVLGGGLSLFGNVPDYSDLGSSRGSKLLRRGNKKR